MRFKFLICVFVMKIKKLFFAVLCFLISINHLQAFDIPDFIDYKGIKDGYPSVHFAITTANKTDDLAHAKKAKNLKFNEQLNQARQLYEQKNWSFFHYFNALIDNAQAPNIFRDKAIESSAKGCF